ncbi:homeobox protein Hox-A2-like [Cydia fagiglandana]|uniref:homeobox protein Hox-A2-like n=1 Tax=Cydia fagiglandana TaxID=1458189 RepID=UPI002FEE3B54
MFQNLVMTGLTPLCNTNEIQDWDNRPFNGKWPENQRISVRGADVKKTIRKKPKRVRTAYSSEQIRALEKIYSTTKYIDAKRRKELAGTLNIGDKALKIWFQNRRMKEKKESSESSCDTSADIVSCQSPIVLVTNDRSEQNVEKPIPYQNSGVSYEPEQYQFPTFYCQDSATGQFYQNGYNNGYGYEPNSPSFGVDTCVYPTQYYPIDNHHNVECNAYNQAQNAYEMDSWFAKSYDYNCYNLQQA